MEKLKNKVINNKNIIYTSEGYFRFIDHYNKLLTTGFRTKEKLITYKDDIRFDVGTIIVMYNNYEKLYADKKIVKIKYGNFCNWYFSDMDKNECSDVVKNLVKSKTITVQGYADNLGYVPMYLVHNKEEVQHLANADEEIDLPKVLLID